VLLSILFSFSISGIGEFPIKNIPNNPAAIPKYPISSKVNLHPSALTVRILNEARPAPKYVAQL